MRGAKFSIPCNEQTSALLFKLPVEVRISILRHLPKHNGIIRSTDRDQRHSIKSCHRDWMPTRSAPVHCSNSDPCLSIGRENLCPELSSQALGTCQLLYHEGHPVLYDENTLEIAWSSGIDDDERSLYQLSLKFCDILDGTNTVSGNLNVLFMRKHLCMDYLRDNFATLPKMWSTIKAKRLLDLLPSISQFTKFHVRCLVHHQPGDDNTFFLMCRAIRHIVKGKDVTIEFLKPDGTDFMVDRDNKLEGARVLRCRSIEFVNAQEAETLRLSRLIQSNEPVHDTFKMWLRFREVEQGVTWSSADHASPSDFTDNECGLLWAALEYDIEKYEECRAQFLNRPRGVCDASAIRPLTRPAKPFLDRWHQTQVILWCSHMP